MTEEFYQEIIWKRKTVSIQFTISINENRKLGDLIGKLVVAADGEPIGNIKFVTEVAKQRKKDLPAKT